MKKLHYNFQNVDTVQGVCPHCEDETILVAIVTEFYRCVNCGADTKQHVNGKISYIQLTESDKDWLRKHGKEI
jgi:anaerobic ribonucleoside-triphosphate reductase|tara:strand:+ start:71 stop:289 length:219 start_codon:yes stop_codon:yes gene_type:complete